MEEKEGNKTKQGGHCIWVRVALITCASRFPHHKRAGIAAAAAHPNPNPSPPWNRPPFRPIRRPRSTLPLSAPPGIESTPPPTASSTPGSWTPITGRLYRRRPRLPPRLLRLPTPPGCRTLPPQPHRSDLFSSALYPSHSLSLSIDLDILIRPSRIHLARKSITVATSHPGAVGVGITRRLIGAQVGGTMAAAAGGVARGATTMAVVEGAALLAGGEGDTRASIVARLRWVWVHTCGVRRPRPWQYLHHSWALSHPCGLLPDQWCFMVCLCIL
jgi:hypothetical protein